MKKLITTIAITMIITIGYINIIYSNERNLNSTSDSSIELPDSYPDFPDFFHEDLFFIFQIGDYNGGDKIGSNSNRAGGVFSADFGFFIKPFEDRSYETQLTYGMGDGRSELSLMEFYRFKHFRVGSGICYHFNHNNNDVTNGDKISFKDTIGLVVEFDYFIGIYDRFEITLSAKNIFIDYEDYDGKVYNGNSTGLFVGFYY